MLEQVFKIQEKTTNILHMLFLQKLSVTVLINSYIAICFSSNVYSLNTIVIPIYKQSKDILKLTSHNKMHKPHKTCS